MYQVIEKCGCAGTCHKMDHMETVLDFSEVEIKDGTNTTDVRPVVRVKKFPYRTISHSDCIYNLSLISSYSCKTAN